MSAVDTIPDVFSDVVVPIEIIAVILLGLTLIGTIYFNEYNRFPSVFFRWILMIDLVSGIIKISQWSKSSVGYPWMGFPATESGCSFIVAFDTFSQIGSLFANTSIVWCVFMSIVLSFRFTLRSTRSTHLSLVILFWAVTLSLSISSIFVTHVHTLSGFCMGRSLVILMKQCLCYWALCMQALMIVPILQHISSSTKKTNTHFSKSAYMRFFGLLFTQMIGVIPIFIVEFILLAHFEVPKGLVYMAVLGQPISHMINALVITNKIWQKFRAFASNHSHSNKARRARERESALSMKNSHSNANQRGSNIINGSHASKPVGGRRLSYVKPTNDGGGGAEQSYVRNAVSAPVTPTLVTSTLVGGTGGISPSRTTFLKKRVQLNIHGEPMNGDLGSSSSRLTDICVELLPQVSSTDNSFIVSPIVSERVYPNEQQAGDAHTPLTPALPPLHPGTGNLDMIDAVSASSINNEDQHNMNTMSATPPFRGRNSSAPNIFDNPPNRSSTATSASGSRATMITERPSIAAGGRTNSDNCIDLDNGRMNMNMNPNEKANNNNDNIKNNNTNNNNHNDPESNRDNSNNNNNNAIVTKKGTDSNRSKKLGPSSGGAIRRSKQARLKFSTLRKHILSVSSTTLFVAISLITCLIIVSTYVEDSDEAVRLQEMVNESVLINNFIHELQKERGYSASYLGPFGWKFNTLLQNERALVNSTRDALLTYWTNTHTDVQTGMRIGMNDAFKGPTHPLTTFSAAYTSIFNSLPALRSNVDKFNTTPFGAADSYSTVVANFCDIINDINSDIHQGDLSRLMISFVSFMYYKEMLGQERGFGTIVINSTGGFIEADVRAVTSMGAQTAFLKTFQSFATPQTLNLYTQLTISSPYTAILNDMEQQMLTFNPTVLIQLNPLDWFGNMTLKINDIKTVHDGIARELIHQSQAIMNQAVGAMIGLMVVIVITMLIGGGAVLLLSVRDVHEQVEEQKNVERTVNEKAIQNPQHADKEKSVHSQSNTHEKSSDVSLEGDVI